MFYSQTFLARKGQLGTVWCAAHLQHRLKKSHYTSTNIPETVDLIMFPEVPLALRLSGHLLLGVVRIYSKKVDYFFRDCTLLRTWVVKAFISTQVDLPENARQAPVELVTLPQTLNLDEFELDDYTLDGEFDKHTRSQEDITLTDQVPTGIDPYVAITFDEDINQESSPMDDEHPGETDIEMYYETGQNNELGDFGVAQDTRTYGPHNDTEETPEFQDPRPSNLTEPVSPSIDRSNASSLGSVPDIEIRRDAANDLSHVPYSPFAAQQQSARVEHTESLDETSIEKDPPSIDAEVSNTIGHSPFELRSRSPGFAGSEEERGNFVHPSPQLALQPTPLPKPQARPRKRKHVDKVTVLTNRSMRERLEDHSDTLRKKKKMPATKVGIWRMNNQSKKDQFVNESLFTGFSSVLGSVFERECVASKPYLAVSDETFPEPASVSSPIREAETEINQTSSTTQATVPDFTDLDSTLHHGDCQETENVQDFASPQSRNAESVAAQAETPQPFDMGIEHLRDGGFPEYMLSPPLRSSPFRTDDFTTQPGTSERRSYRTESPFRTDDFTTQPGTSERRSYRTGPSTSTSPENLTGLRNSGISAIPEMVDEELYFLEVDGNTPVRSPASQDSNALTERTRALAQYLKERFSSTPTSSNGSGDISLSKTLAGKTRKLAARMFFETLVLKSRGLVDVKQDQPYSDIALKLMPVLFSKV